ncbi:hypothetical protein BS47DRAFT_972142 [Hydnum rufescens UP504]|uniref:Uncharacterized protein n=1 Tax=Hydnum rufescens UP504 TaxID=1448309 RepID=A0A9P6AXW4_9AGAM|nr:hypothetical protein BS47DRAFT_972142 [Hydnum rufescens UP504]
MQGIKACVPFLKLLHHQSIPSKPDVCYLVFVCLVILWIREGRHAYSPDAHETEHTASSIQAQIKDHGDFQKYGSYNIAWKLARIIDQYTAL